MHRETSKFKQSVLTLVSRVSSIGIRDNNNTYITPTMILHEDIKPIEHVLLHLICVRSHLMCACKHWNIKLGLSLYYWTHWSCWWMRHFKKARFTVTRFFIIKPRHPGRLKKSKSGWKNPQWEPGPALGGWPPEPGRWGPQYTIHYI